MKTSIIIALFTAIYLSHSSVCSSVTDGQLGAGQGPQKNVPLKPMSMPQSWLKTKRSTDSGKTQTSRPTAHPYYTAQTRPVDHYSTRRRNFKMGPLYNFISRRQSTVHSGQATTPRGTNPLTSDIRVSHTTEQAVRSIHNGAVNGHNFVTTGHRNAFNGSLLVTRDRNVAFIKSQPTTSGHPTATTKRRTPTSKYIHNTTANHLSTTGNSTSVHNTTLTISKPFNSTFQVNVTIMNQVLSGDSECTAFICDDGLTLTGDSFVCDGVINCIDGSDEISADDDDNCSDTKTLCSEGICINQYMHKAFASYCKSSPQPEVVVTPTECESDSDYMCANQAQCVSSTDICDGAADCDDGSDEYACPCKGFHCGNGNCVSANAACNGVDDCGDSSDESSPTCTANTNRKSCGDYFASGRFHCNNGYCVEKSSVCDGISDCGDQTDENDVLCNPVTQAPAVAICSPSQYVCSNQNCVTKDKICDDSDDCGDNSDEDFCYLKSINGFTASTLAYSFAGAGGLFLLIILVALVAHCRRKKTSTRREIQRSPVLNMQAPPPSYEECGSNSGNSGVSFENPLSELKARF